MGQQGEIHFIKIQVYAMQDLNVRGQKLRPTLYALH